MSINNYIICGGTRITNSKYNLTSFSCKYRRSYRVIPIQ